MGAVSARTSTRSAMRSDSTASSPWPARAPPTRESDVVTSMPLAPTSAPLVSRVTARVPRLNARRGTTTSRAGASGIGRRRFRPAGGSGRRSGRRGCGPRDQALEAPLAPVVADQRDGGPIETQLRDLEPAAEEGEEPGTHDEGVGAQQLTREPGRISHDDLTERGAREERDVHLAHGDRGAERLLGGAHRGPPERLGLEVTGEHEESRRPAGRRLRRARRPGS